MTIKKIYVCDYDDCEFETAEECRAYEIQWRHSFKHTKFYRGRTRMSFNKDTAEYCYNNATRVMFPDYDTVKLFNGYYGWCCKHTSEDNNSLIWKVDEEHNEWVASDK